MRAQRKGIYFCIIMIIEFICNQLIIYCRLFSICWHSLQHRLFIILLHISTREDGRFSHPCILHQYILGMVLHILLRPGLASHACYGLTNMDPSQYHMCGTLIMTVRQLGDISGYLWLMYYIIYHIILTVWWRATPLCE